MKKVIIVLALVALVLVPVAAKGVASVGVELGQPSGLTVGYQINEKWNGYATAAFGFGSQSYIDAVVGGQYKVTDFKVEKAKFDVNVGLQAGALILLGDTSGLKVTARATGSVSYDWTWKNVGDFTAYLRGGLGVGIALSESTKTGVSGALALGCVYHL